MSGSKTFSLPAALMAILLVAGPVLGTKVYTTDTQELTLRAVPGNRGKAITNLPPASALELVKEHGWTLVRYTDPGGKSRDGWVPSRFLGAWPPDSSIAKEIGGENEALKQQLGVSEKERSALLEKEKELTDKLVKLNGAYEELKKGSADYLKLKTEYDTAKTTLASAQENIQTLVQENENLKMSQLIRWFMAGALVLLLGLFLGWVSGRRQKRKKSTYFY